MPRYTVIYKDKYMHFSGIDEKPLTYFMDKEKFKEYYTDEYSLESWKKFEYKKRNILNLEKAVFLYNLNNMHKLTEKQFLEKYKF